ncbi:MAG: hypothetical protein ACFE7R_06585 [Candidatus Hodarchaeota archaeon]
MLETKRIALLKQVIAKEKIRKHREIKESSEHPDLREMRCDRAAEEALREHEKTKSYARSYLVRG